MTRTAARAGREMVLLTRGFPGIYRDSVALMQLSSTLTAMPGVEQAAVVMGTPANLDLLREIGLLTEPPDARASDILAVVRAHTAAAAGAALERTAAALESHSPASGGRPEAIVPQSMAMARTDLAGANLALISVPGEYAAAEARKALGLGLNVLLFSDNVPLAEEIELKTAARERGLLMMGPDCGTALIGGVPLGFANAVRRGPIGCIGASGTGLQQVTSLIDRLGLGVSHAIGTGGRDLNQAVGGLTMLAALDALARDDDTKVLVLVSKPPSAEVARKVLAAAARVGKPVVVTFIGMDPSSIDGTNLHPAPTLEDAARTAVALARGKRPPARGRLRTVPARPRFAAGQRYLRGLYTGGTFCYEASALLGDLLGRVWSNTPAHAEDALDDPWQSREHTVVDLGDDVFTRGRPHPLIDTRLRDERIVREAHDPGVAAILFDVVLGHGCPPDPAAALLPALAGAREAAARKKRRIAFVAFACGTHADPQGLARQETALRDAGVLLARSNAEAYASPRQSSASEAAGRDRTARTAPRGRQRRLGDARRRGGARRR